jgi:hypothetical protein
MRNSLIALSRFLVISVLFVCMSACVKPTPKPPSEKELYFRAAVPLQQIPSSQNFKASVSATTTFKTPKPGKLCDDSQIKTHEFQMLGPDDYVQFCITDFLGVPPGIGESRGYVLVRNEGRPFSQSWRLTMQQKSPATTYLHHECWALQLNAVEKISDETGDGVHDTAPPDGLGFPRKYDQSLVGGEYTLYVVNSGTVGRLTGVLNFRITNKERVCR